MTVGILEYNLRSPPMFLPFSRAHGVDVAPFKPDVT